MENRFYDETHPELGRDFRKAMQAGSVVLQTELETRDWVIGGHGETPEVQNCGD